MRLTLASTAFVTGLVFSTAALAATVTPTGGEVLINRGTGFERVTGAAQANAGDTVMASPKGGAQIVYSDGCSVPVVPGRVITITAEPPCREFAQARREDDDDANRQMNIVGSLLMAAGVANAIRLALDEKDGLVGNLRASQPGEPPPSP